MKKEAEIKISASAANGFLFEKYEYSPGAVEPLPPHTHAEYQFSISPNAVGEYLCRGGKYVFAPQTLGIIHTGERHAPSDKSAVEQDEIYYVLYLAPEEIMKAAREIGWRKNELPYFKNFLIADERLAARYLSLFGSSNDNESQLARDIDRLDFLTFLVANFAQNKDTSEETHLKSPGRAAIAREFLDANFSRAVSLDELAAVAGVGKFYLCREFKRVVGISPHLYQNQLRVNRARQILLNGKSIVETADELGFYDQSHFGKNFKKFVGITPQSYAAQVDCS